MELRVIHREALAKVNESFASKIADAELMKMDMEAQPLQQKRSKMAAELLVGGTGGLNPKSTALHDLKSKWKKELKRVDKSYALVRKYTPPTVTAVSRGCRKLWIAEKKKRPNSRLSRNDKMEAEVDHGDAFRKEHLINYVTANASCVDVLAAANLVAEHYEARNEMRNAAAFREMRNLLFQTYDAAGPAGQTEEHTFEDIVSTTIPKGKLSRKSSSKRGGPLPESPSSNKRMKLSK
mmetsp:Transcript_9146/g.22796  ORF Transcript_9146/g.22796 Transcript_9146/m.22796 type:complete len:237 (-) Transcript_9146:147-857(-)